MAESTRNFAASIAIRVLKITAVVAALATLLAAPAQALVVVNPGTDVPLTGNSDPGWSNVTIAGGRNFIYLGDGWALSVRHVGPQVSDPAASQALQFSTGMFNLVPNQNFVIDNPATMSLTGATALHPFPTGDNFETDLRLVRLNSDPGLPSIFVSDPQSPLKAKFQLATTAPPLGAQITIVGSGPSKNSGEMTWNSNWQTVSPPGSFTGFTASNLPADIIKRYGTNNLANTASYSNIFSQTLTSTTGVVPLVTPDGFTRDVASLVASFDQIGGNESQAVSGDSGSSVFYKNGSQWNLAGFVDGVFTFQQQPGLTAVYGDLTSYVDLSFYHDQIMNVINAHKNYSLIGDVNLDGVISGNGSGPAATDDVTAFIQGWGSSQADGDITSWKKGDLNLDGKVDVSDFLMLRSAFNASGAGASLNNLAARLGAGSGGVPEPSSFLLAAIGAGLLSLVCKRSRSRLR